MKDSDLVRYVRDTLAPFTKQPFSETDSLLLSMICYWNFPAGDQWTSLRGLFRAELFEGLMEGIRDRTVQLKLLAAIAASPRFRDLEWGRFRAYSDHDTSMQFAAVTFRISPDTYYIACRGTDSSFAGWREDMNLSLGSPVPSQQLALRYLRRTAEHLQGRLLIGGHSKGGNLAVYAAAHAPGRIRDRIDGIWSFDGPGFLTEDLQEPGFAAVRDRICKLVPQSSLVGMFFEQECELQVVRSSAAGAAQHDPMTWQISDGRLTRTALTPKARLSLKTINGFIADLSFEERARIIDAVFSILEESGADSFDDLHSQKLPALIRAAVSLDRDTKHFLLHALHQLRGEAVRSVPKLFRGTDPHAAKADDAEEKPEERPDGEERSALQPALPDGK